jgi:hypothetical protein
LPNIAGRFTDRIGNWMRQRNIDRIASTLFSDNGLDYLRQLGGMPAGSHRALALTAEFLGQQAGGLKVGGAPPTQLPPPTAGVSTYVGNPLLQYGTP